MFTNNLVFKIQIFLFLEGETRSYTSNNTLYSIKILLMSRQ